MRSLHTTRVEQIDEGLEDDFLYNFYKGFTFKSFMLVFGGGVGGVEVLRSNCWSHSLANMFCSSGSSARTSRIGILLGTFLDFLPDGNLL